MPLPPILENVRRRTGIYVVPSTLDCVMNYLAGYDDALMGGLLVGFREWLVVRLDAGNNLAWMALIKRILKEQGILLGDEKAQIEALFALLEECFHERDQYQGLFQIYRRYERWLRAQDWYQEEALAPAEAKPPKN